MTSEGQKCGLTSFLPMSCRGRAEAFARRLHSRLRSLGSHDDNGSADESSWLAANENPIAISQPRHGPDSELYLDFGLTESPGSPDEELEQTELHKLLNKDTLKHSHSNDCNCSKKNNILLKTSNTNDSDSDCSFYDTENDSEQRLNHHVNGDTNSESSKSQENETGIDISSQDISSTQEESFATTSDCTPQPSSSLSEDASTLSLRDEDCPSIDVSESLTDISKCITDDGDNDYQKCNGDHNGEVEIEEKTETNFSSNEDAEFFDGILNAVCLDSSEVTTESSVENQTDVETKDNNAEGEDDSEEMIPRVRRCSSLKTGKTPPNTPCRKKIVRFADALGLDLADIRTFLDEIPKVPISAYEDLRGVDFIDSSSDGNLVNTMNKFHGITVDKILMPLFQQPGGQPNFLDVVRDNQVCLENALVDDPLSLSVRGTVRVRNLDFHKSVYIRYTLDSWKTFADVQATYVDNSCDGFSDKFSFLLYAHTLSVGQRIEFACRFQCKGCQYWDANNGANYCFQCLPATTSHSSMSCVDDWGASFY